MKQIIETGKTVEEALEKALKALELDKNQVEIEILQEPTKGFLGLLGGRDATIRVRELQVSNSFEVKKSKSDTLKDSYSEKSEIEEKIECKVSSEENKNVVSDDIDPDVESKIREFLDVVLGAMKVKYELSLKKFEDTVHIQILSDKPEEMGVVIGKRGATLDSLQYLLSLVVNKNREDYVRVVLDSENYRSKREETLEKFAKKMADKVVKTRRPVKLESMNPYERRIVHSVLQDYRGVKTHSEGKEPYRHVVITMDKYKTKF